MNNAITPTHTRTHRPPPPQHHKQEHGHDGNEATGGGANLSYCARDLIFMFPPLVCGLVVVLAVLCCFRKSADDTAPDGTFAVNLADDFLSGVSPLHIAYNYSGGQEGQMNEIVTQLEEATGADIHVSMIRIRPNRPGDTAWVRADSAPGLTERDLVDADLKVNLKAKLACFGDCSYQKLRRLRVAMLALVGVQITVCVWIVYSFLSDVQLYNSTNATNATKPAKYSKYDVIPLEVVICQIVKALFFVFLIVIEFKRFDTSLRNAFASMDWLAVFYVFFFIGALAQMVTNAIGVDGTDPALQTTAQVLAVVQCFAALVLLLLEWLPTVNQGQRARRTRSVNCCQDFKSFFLPFQRSGVGLSAFFLVVVILSCFQGWLTIHISEMTGLVIISAGNAYGPTLIPSDVDSFKRDLNHLLMWFAILQVFRNCLTPLFGSLLQQFVADNRRSSLLKAILEQIDPRESVAKSDKSQRDTATTYNKDVGDSVSKKVSALSKIAESSGKMVFGLAKIARCSVKMFGFCIIVYMISIMAAYLKSKTFEKPRGNTIQRAKKSMETEASALIGKNYRFAVTNQITESEAVRVQSKATQFLQAQYKKACIGAGLDFISKSLLVWVGRVGSIYFAARLLEKAEIDTKQFGKLVGMQLTMMMATVVFANNLESLFQALGEFDTRIKKITDNQEAPVHPRQPPIPQVGTSASVEYQRNFAMQMQGGVNVAVPTPDGALSVNMQPQPFSRRIGLVGESGAGKSTVVQVFQGWLRTHVQSYTDGAMDGGDAAQRARVVVPVINPATAGEQQNNEYDLETGEGNVSIVRLVTSYAPTADGIVVFEGRSWRENIVGCHPSATPPLTRDQEDALIREAVQTACAADVIDVDHLDERGPPSLGLSTGQAKRFGLVRALCKPTAKIYFLDEPEANLSEAVPDGAALSQRDQVVANLIAYSDANTDKTFVIISHNDDVLDTFCHERFSVPGPLPFGPP